jgi:5-formyl-3-hydroxy-2-methylpyridine 4-carboxylic acid 5-dehydrogenase
MPTRTSAPRPARVSRPRRGAVGARGPRSKRAEIAVHDNLPQAVAGADLVIETVPENLELKIQVFREIEAQVADDCMLASDTSGIPITKIQAGTRVPGRVVGMHWSNPPHIIPMIEVIAGEQTAPGS